MSKNAWSNADLAEFLCTTETQSQNLEVILQHNKIPAGGVDDLRNEIEKFLTPSVTDRRLRKLRKLDIYNRDNIDELKIVAKFEG